MDRKLESFLAVCDTMNYRKASELLHLTQPAVTKQVQALEYQYGAKLFHYDGRRLEKTEKGAILERYARSLLYNYQELNRQMHKEPKRQLYIGATKTIGDYVLQEQILKYLQQEQNEITLHIDNTENLLAMLNSHQLDFALVEGVFPKEEYHYQVYKEEPFVGICHKSHPFCGRTISAKELAGQDIIIRETGSGTRDLLERELSAQGFTLDLFRRVICISSFQVIKNLIQNGVGITFGYEAVLEGDESYGTFQVKEFKKSHFFHIVYLENTPANLYAEMFLSQEE